MIVKELVELLKKIKNQDMIIKVLFDDSKYMDVSSVGIQGPMQYPLPKWMYLLIVEEKSK